MNFLQRIKDGAGRASERAQSAVEIGRLNSHISDIQREIEVHFQRMGQVFYESYSKRDTAAAEEEIQELCTVCDLLTEEIAELRIRIAKLRNERLCECGTRLADDTVVCPHCGRQIEPAVSEEKAAEPQAEVELGKKAPVQNKVEAEAVHDLVDDPDFISEDRENVQSDVYADERSVREVQDDSRREPYYEEEANEQVYTEVIRPEDFKPQPAVETSYDAEDEQFETKRFDLGREDDERRNEAEYGYGAAELQDEAEEIEYSPSREQSPRSEEESALEREERQRRELREIRIRERRKMKEERGQTTNGEQLEPEIGREEEPVSMPAVPDPEIERRQRERVEREKERQDELDRLIASWNRGGAETDEDEIAADEEPFVARRPVGEVVRCQVCGSGLPKGSKWCPHCASEQV